MSFLTKDQILGADDRGTEPVDVPEWGGKVLVRGMTGKDRADYIASTVLIRGKQTAPDMSNMQAKLVARCIVGDDGARLFADQDIEALGEKSAAALERVFEVASKLSGLTDDDLETLAGPFDAATSGGSTSS